MLPVGGATTTQSDCVWAWLLAVPPIGGGVIPGRITVVGPLGPIVVLPLNPPGPVWTWLDRPPGPDEAGSPGCTTRQPLPSLELLALALVLGPLLLEDAALLPWAALD